MARSQNGWSVVGTDKIVDKEVLGVEFPNGWLKGDVDIIFTELIRDLNKIEGIVDGWCWGYYVKNIEGSNTISNHASGTAFDYNAPLHPMGKRNTYPEEKRNQINALLRTKYKNKIRWGANYTGRADDMHFEIHDDEAGIHELANEIREANKPPRKPAIMELTVKVPALHQGDSDADFDGYNLIMRMQRIVGVPADGEWGPVTTAAIARWCGISVVSARTLTEETYRKVFGAGR